MKELIQELNLAIRGKLQFLYLMSVGLKVGAGGLSIAPSKMPQD